MWLVAEASQSERKERLGVGNVKTRHLVASGAPFISARLGAFISRLCPGPPGAGRKIKAEQCSPTCGVTLCGTRQCHPKGLSKSTINMG